MRCAAGSPGPSGAGAAARPTLSGSTRRRLLRGAQRLTADQRATLFAKLLSADPNEDIAAAWIAKELLRELLSCADRGGLRYEITTAVDRFYRFCATWESVAVHRDRIAGQLDVAVTVATIAQRCAMTAVATAFAEQ